MTLFSRVRRISGASLQSLPPMPMVSIDGPAGLPLTAKKRLVRQVNAALVTAYGITENIIFLREYPRENVAIAGVLRSTDGGVPVHATSPQKRTRPVSS